MRELADRFLAARRQGRFGSRPVFELYKHPSQADLAKVEERIGRRLPSDLKSWLLIAGYGDIDRVLSFRDDWLQPIQEGEHKSGFLFAQDELGSFYGLSSADEQVVFFPRAERSCAVIAPSFEAMLIELERRDYRILQWMDSVDLVPYA